MKHGLESRVIDELSGGGRVLVSRLDYLGDVILTTPVIDALKTRFPKAEIDYLARSPGADVLDGDPRIAKVFRAPAKGEGPGATLAAIRALRRRRYAAAIDLYSNPRSALVMFFSGAPLRIGGSRRIRRHLYTHSIRVPRSIRPATQHHLAHLEPLGIEDVPDKPIITLTNADRARAAALMADLGVGPGKPTIGIHPGGKWEVKRWPVRHFVELSSRMIERLGARIVVLCGPGEEPFRDEMRNRLGVRAVYAPTLPIRDMAALIDALDAMVVCDGGIMHLSVAVSTPTVGIFGSSEPDIWFPYEAFGPYEPAWIPITCRPCHSHVCDHLSCLERLSVGAVEQRLLDVLGAGETSSRSAR